MPESPVMPASTRDRSRREEILASALRCFGRNGYSNTTIEDIRRASGASIGSLYHHFGGKDRIAAALYVEGLAGYQSAFLAALLPHDDARAGIEAVVRGHLRWVRQH